MSDKKRVDVALVERGLAQSREKAQALVMSGVVYIGENKVDKASAQVMPEDELIVRQTGTGYVSRGALKLEKGLAVFGVEAKDRVAMDLGASTGGFTDVLLQNGAAHVYAIDVGYGQLDWKLRNEPRVTVMERTNARYLTADDLPLRPTLGVMDVSFISITKILPAAAAIMGENGEFISLIKPQFEAGRDRVGKKGVVRDAQVHLDVVKEILHFIDADMDWTAQNLSFSPIKGPEGNIEFLVHILPKERATHSVTEQEAAEVVRQAHESLGNA
ncbi:MAG: TlyA family RNA methyltransferase [Christensenellales bacterium]